MLEFKIVVMVYHFNVVIPNKGGISRTTKQRFVQQFDSIYLRQMAIKSSIKINKKGVSTKMIKTSVMRIRKQEFQFINL